MEAGGSGDWEEMLGRLSVCITRQEEAAMRQAAADTGSPGHHTDLHNHVAALLVEHGITTWANLHASFPGVRFLHTTCLLFCLGWASLEQDFACLPRFMFKQAEGSAHVWGDCP